ncbi:MAG: RimK family alpha-L-glutamate ligase [Bacillota bacterium]
MRAPGEAPRIGILGTSGAEGSWLEKALLQEGAAVHRVSVLGMATETRRVGEALRVTCTDGTRADHLDALLVRSLPGGSLERVIYRVNVLHSLESLGVMVVNSPVTIEMTVDKFYTTALLGLGGIPVPTTFTAERYDQAMAVFREMGRAVVKPLFGSRGRGSMLIDDVDLAHRVFRALETGSYVYYIQEYLPHGNEDYRLFTVGDRLAGAMRRCSNLWKANIACGATAEAFTPGPQLVELALRTAKILRADYLGIDIVLHEGKPYVIEANGIPGWAGLQSVCSTDIARCVAMHTLGRVARERALSRSSGVGGG